MKVSITWLKDLVEIKSIEEVERLLPLRTIGTKEITTEFIELDMKGYNRADLLSLRGVALEVAAITDSQVKFTDLADTDYIWVAQSLPKVEIKIEGKDLCPVYCVAKIENLKVKPSNPNWLKKLADSGIRPVNNVADITNLVMLEYGQPLHAFDAKAVKNEAIIVRAAKAREKITTLDGKTRELEKTDLLITDPQNNLGIAGVMGGKDSEVTDSTTTILLEAAIFDPTNLRRTATRLGIQSEAGKRFYHGLAKKRLLQALDTAIRMYQDLGGKLTALTIVGDTVDQQKKIPLTLEKTNSLIGVNLKPEQVEQHLKKLHFETEPVASGEWRVAPPYWRLDINIEEDLIEEVARMYGYEKIPAKELPGSLPPKIDQKLFELIYTLKTTLADLGLTEVQTYSFYSTDILNRFKYQKQELVKIENPISSETEFLKNHLWPNLLEVISKNLKQDFKDIAIFEIGKVYHPAQNSVPTENYKLSLALYNDTDNPTLELYGILNTLSAKLNLDISLKDRGDQKKGDHFHPTRYKRLSYKGKDVGKIAEVHPRITDQFGLEKRAAVLEIALDNLL